MPGRSNFWDMASTKAGTGSDSERIRRPRRKCANGSGNWYRRGIVLQVNKGSVLGAFGHRAGETAVRLLNRGLIHVIASDAHSPRRRTPELESVRQWALEHLGREYTRLLLEENPGRIALGQRVQGFAG